MQTRDAYAGGEVNMLAKAALGEGKQSSKAPNAGEPSAHWHSAKYITAGAAYSHAESKDSEIRDALARLGYAGAYSLHAGFAEDMVRLGRQQEEIHIVLDSHISDDVCNALAGIVSPYPAIVYTPEETHFIPTPQVKLQRIPET